MKHLVMQKRNVFGTVSKHGQMEIRDNKQSVAFFWSVGKSDKNNVISQGNVWAEMNLAITANKPVANHLATQVYCA